MKPIVLGRLRWLLLVLCGTGSSCARTGFLFDQEPSDGSPCLTNADCREACINDACASQSNVGGPCDEDEDCQSSLTCILGSCEPYDECVATGCGTVKAVYSNASDWMDYVKNSGGNGMVWNRCDGPCPALPPYAGVPCVGDEDGYFACAHGGELRFFEAANQSSCDGLSAEDALGAFDWRCDASTDRVLFFSKRLKRDKGLRDLIVADPALEFLENSVTVSRANEAVFRTQATRWWSNTLEELPRDNSTPAVLSANTIYVTDEDAVTNGYSVSSSDRVALVTLGSSQIVKWNDASLWWCEPDGSVGSGEYPLLCLGGTSSAPSRFLWIEARLNGYNQSTGHNSFDVLFFGDDVWMSRVHRTEVTGGGMGGANDQAAIRSNSASTRSILFDGTRAYAGAPGQGEPLFEILSSPHVTVLDCLAAQASDIGPGFHMASPNGVLARSMAMGNDFSGFEVEATDAPQTLVGLTAAANGGPGILLMGPGAGSAVLLASAAFNNLGLGPNVGVGIETNQTTVANLVHAGTPDMNCLHVGGNQNFLRDVASAYNSCGFNVGGDNNTFSGSLWFGHTGGGPGCLNFGSGNNIPSSDTCTPASGFAPVGNVDPQSFYVGMVPSDASNTTPGFGVAMPLASITDWIRFDNPYRGWGVSSGATLFDPGNTGPCTSGDCQLYDFTLTGEETLFRNQFGVWTRDGVCPTSVDSGSTAEAIMTDAVGRVFLVYAMELFDLWENPNGDFDGLCESNEACVFTPNVGSYQGRGDPTTTTPCLIAGGNGVTNVTLYAFPVN